MRAERLLFSRTVKVLWTTLDISQSSLHGLKMTCVTSPTKCTFLVFFVIKHVTITSFMKFLKLMQTVVSNDLEGKSSAYDIMHRIYAVYYELN